MIEMRFPSLEKYTKLPNIEEEEFDIFIAFLYFGDCSFSLSNLSKLLEMCKELKLDEFKEIIMESLKSVDVEELLKLNIKEIEGICKEMQIKLQEKYGIPKLPTGKAPPPPPLNNRTINKQYQIDEESIRSVGNLKSVALPKDYYFDDVDWK
jgi:hypothetical protein